jgi:hypothetical protein
MTLVGFKNSGFKGKDGTYVDGVTLFFTETRRDVEGLSTEKVFITSAKLGNYVPVIGDELTVLYNRWGKVVGIVPWTDVPISAAGVAQV